MLLAYRDDAGRLVAGPPEPETEVIWYDLVSPTQEEEHAVEAIVGLDVPTAEEIAEIEASSRLFRQGDAVFMTATVMLRADSDDPSTLPVSLILAQGRLISLRYGEPRPFATFIADCQRRPQPGWTGPGVLAGLLGAIVDRLADVLEHVGREIDAISHTVFRHRGTAASQSRALKDNMMQIGRHGDLLSKARESQMSLVRLTSFLSLAAVPGIDRGLRAEMKSLTRDLQSLGDYAGFLSSKLTFLLDAILGLINIAQTDIIKIFSVVAVVFLPPTLIASIYGMNFAFMPELGWPWGYPLAVLMMLVSAILPYQLFKRRGWL